MYFPILLLVAVLLCVLGYFVPKVRDVVTYFAYCLIVVYLTALLLGVGRLGP